MATKEDIQRVIEHSDRRFEALIKEMDKRFEEARIERKTLRQQFEVAQEERKAINQQLEGARIEREGMNEQFVEARKERSELKISIVSLGRRSGDNLENAILELLSEKLIKENIKTSKIHKEILLDREGIVFMKNYSTDLDIIIENEKINLVEIKYLLIIEIFFTSLKLQNYIRK